jgi:DNA-binding NarL/FixJ family response regulator
MTRRHSTDSTFAEAPPLPLTPAHWRAIFCALGLSPKQSQVVELVLRGLCNKQITEAMGIRGPTVRTYFERIEARTGTHGRMELAMKVLAISHEVAFHAGVVKLHDTESMTPKM